MKRLLFLLGAMLAAVSAQAADYSGTWLLDKSRSANLPPYYSQIKAHKLTIGQAGNQLTVDVDIERDQAFKPLHLVYNLDGTPTQNSIEVRTPSGSSMVPNTATTKVAADGSLHIDVVTEMKRGDQVMSSTLSEDWKLSDDGKTLNVRMERKGGPPGASNVASDLVFVRQ